MRNYCSCNFSGRTGPPIPEPDYHDENQNGTLLLQCGGRPKPIATSSLPRHHNNTNMLRMGESRDTNLHQSRESESRPSSVSEIREPSRVTESCDQEPRPLRVAESHDTEIRPSHITESGVPEPRSSRDPLIARPTIDPRYLEDNTDESELIQPRKLVNPCLESKERQDLHREMIFNKKR